MDFQNIISHPFTWGLLVGLFLLAVSMWSHFKTKRELWRYRRHLSDKLELEAKNFEALKKETDALKRENENLRVKVASLSERPEQKLERDLEILARAERRMMVSAPGFAAAWENAKSDAMHEMVEEEQGRSLPKRLFRKIFGAGAKELPPGEGDEPHVHVHDAEHEEKKSDAKPKAATAPDSADKPEPKEKSDAA